MGLNKLLFIISFLFLNLTLFAQVNPDLSEQYESYYQSNKSIQGLIQLNQDVYVPSDRLYFSIQLLDQNLIHSTETMYVDVGILDPSNDIVENHKLKLIKGIGASSISLEKLNQIGFHKIMVYDQDGFITPTTKTFTIVSSSEIKPTKDSKTKNWISIKRNVVQITNANNSASQVLLTHKGKVVQLLEIDDSDNLEILVNEIPNGLNCLYVINESSDVIFSIYLIQHAPIEIALDLSKTQSRSSSSLEFNLSNNTDDPINAISSINVYNEMYATSYLEREVETNNSLRVFDPNLIKPSFEWAEETKRPSKISISKYLASGKAFHNNSKKELSEGTKILFLSSEQLEIGVARVDKDGQFLLDIPRLIGADDLFYVAQSVKGARIDDINIKWDESIIPDMNLIEVDSKFSNQESDYVKYQSKSKIIDLAYSSHYKDLFVETVSAVNFDAKYFEPDNHYDLRNYKIFPSMEEMITEVFTVLSTSEKKRKKYIILNKLEVSKFGNTPLFIIDGIPTLDVDHFLNLNPIDLKSLSVYSNRHNLKKLGALGIFGIIKVDTKTNDQGPSLNSSNKILGKLESLPFYTSNNKSQDLPIFNTTIHWQAGISIQNGKSKTINWATSDDLGKYTIRIVGITENGIPFQHTKTIEVELNTQ